MFGLYGLVKIYQPKVLNHTIHKLLIYTDTHIHMKTNVCVWVYNIYLSLDHTQAVHIYDDSGHLVRIYIKINEYEKYYNTLFYRFKSFLYT